MPGGREVFAEVIRVATPNNFYPCLLSLASSFGLFHGQLLRRVTAGQLPVVISCSYFENLIKASVLFSALPKVSAEGQEPGQIWSW